MQQASLVAACVYHATNKMVAHEETSNYHRNVHLYSLAGSKVLDLFPSRQNQLQLYHQPLDSGH
jgi:hypothetical protein